MDSELDRLRKKVENFPSPSAYSRLAELLRLAGDMEGALTVCTRSIREFPRHGQVYVIAATIHLSRNESPTAIELLRTAVQQDSRCYPALRMLADLHLQQQQPAEALAVLRKILAFKPADEVVQQLATALEKETKAAPTAKAADREALTVDLETIDLRSCSGPLTSITQLPRAGAPGESPRIRTLERLCSQPSVRGALVFDPQGRVVLSKVPADTDENVLAALSLEVSRSALASIRIAGGTVLSNWSVFAEKGQLVAFVRPAGPSLVVIADTGIKTALLEMHAQQALLDLGAL